MPGQFPDRKTPGIPPDLVMYADAARQYRDQTKQLLENERANENVRIANENARKTAEIGRSNAEAVRVAQERQRVSAETARQRRFGRLEARILELEDSRARIAKVERLLDELVADYELVSLAIDTLGVLHNDVPYLYLNRGLHCGESEMEIVDGVPVFAGGTMVDGVFNIAGVINAPREPHQALPPGVDYALIGEGLHCAEGKMHIDNGTPVFDDAIVEGEALKISGLIKTEE